MEAERAPNGSRWYLHGQHYVVVAQTTRDGEPAVMLKNVRLPKARARSIIARLLDRHGHRYEKETA